MSIERIPALEEGQIYLLGDTRIDDVGVRYKGEPVTSAFLQENQDIKDAVLRVCSHVYGAPIRIVTEVHYNEVMESLKKSQ